MKRRLIVVVGPTGSGKSALSMELARHYHAPIVSTDSRQFYRGIPIGTAQPSQADLAEIEHHFIACRELEDDYNAGSYEQDALECLSELFERFDTVIAVGGSGLYIKALCEGLDDLPEVSAATRESLRREYLEQGLAPLLEELRLRDIECYERIDRANSSRVLRALEICRDSELGRYSAYCQGGATSQDASGVRGEMDIVKIGIDLPRAELYDRINRRVDEMVEMGLESEVRGVYSRRMLNSLQTVGYRELFAYISGDCTYDRAIDMIKQNSRRYAKRQMTWFRRDMGIRWFERVDIESVVCYLGEIKNG